ISPAHLSSPLRTFSTQFRTVGAIALVLALAVGLQTSFATTEAHTGTKQLRISIVSDRSCSHDLDRSPVAGDAHFWLHEKSSNIRAVSYFLYRDKSFSPLKQVHLKSHDGPTFDFAGQTSSGEARGYDTRVLKDGT